MKKSLPLLIGSFLFLNLNAWAGMWFWDTNDTDPNSGSATPTGTWGVDPYWNSDATGGAGAEAGKGWTDGATAVFAAGDDAIGEYTIIVSNTVNVSDIHVDLGSVTFAPDSVAGGALYLVNWVKLLPDDVYPSLVDTTNRLLSVGHKDPNAVAKYNVPITGATNIFRYKRGTLIFGETNTYAGSTTIEGGVLQLGVPYAIATNSTLVLSNDNGREDVGWIGLTMNTPATFATGGFGQKLGPLQLGGPDPNVPRSIDFGNGASALVFADSSAQNWLSTEGLQIPLHILNYTLGTDSLRFGTSASGLTSAQLSQIQFADFGNVAGKIDASGFVTPVLPAPVIQSITKDGATATLVWSAVPNGVYCVQYRDSLSAGTWTSLPNVTASGNTASYPDSNATPSSRFYRVKVVY